MQYYYLFGLVFSLLGLGLADWRYELVIFRLGKPAIITILCGVGFFLSWDIVGIVLGVFATNQDWVTGLHIISPNLPVEEVLFLTLLCYSTLLTWRLVWQRTS